MNKFTENIAQLRKHFGSNREVARNLGVSERGFYRVMQKGGTARIRLHAGQLVELIELRKLKSTSSTSS